MSLNLQLIYVFISSWTNQKLWRMQRNGRGNTLWTRSSRLDRLDPGQPTISIFKMNGLLYNCVKTHWGQYASCENIDYTGNTQCESLIKACLCFSCYWLVSFFHKPRNWINWQFKTSWRPFCKVSSRATMAVRIMNQKRDWARSTWSNTCYHQSIMCLKFDHESQYQGNWSWINFGGEGRCQPNTFSR